MMREIRMLCVGNPDSRYQVRELIDEETNYIYYQPYDTLVEFAIGETTRSLAAARATVRQYREDLETA